MLLLFTITKGVAQKIQIFSFSYLTILNFRFLKVQIRAETQKVLLSEAKMDEAIWQHQWTNICMMLFAFIDEWRYDNSG